MTSFGVLALLPAAVTIVAALATRRVTWALFCGVAAGSLALGGLQPLPVLTHLATTLYGCFADLERLQIGLFLLLVGGLLALLGASGGYARAAAYLEQRLHRPRRARLATVGLGLLLFFDDYASVLLAGSSLRGLRNRLGISPALGAYLVDQTATVVSVMVLSTWAAFEASLLGSSYQGQPPVAGVELLLRSLPYHLFTYLGLALAVVVAWQGRWFGRPLETPTLRPVETAPASDEAAGRVRLVHVLAPLGVLLLGAPLGLFGSGLIGLLLRPSDSGASGGLPLIELLGAAPTVQVLLGVSALALALALVQLGRAKVLPGRAMAAAVAHGAWEMFPAAMVILLAKGLAGVAEELGTGPYLTSLVGPWVSPAGVPALTFGLAFLVTVATGFSWSSMTIVTPVAFALATQHLGPAALPVVAGAVISGAIAGGMVIPFSDTSVMTAAACGMTPLYHARTQLPQILVTSLAALLGYGLIGAGVAPGWALLAGLALLGLAQQLFARPGCDAPDPSRKQSEAVRSGSREPAPQAVVLEIERKP